MKITLVQNAPKLNRSNLEEVIALVEEHKDKSDVIVFSELALNGYMLQDKLYEDAWNVDELSPLAQLSHDIDIVVGAAIRETQDSFHNGALYFSSGKLLSDHHKVHLPNYGMFEEARYFQAGDKFESFETSYGKVSMLVCEDLWHESMRNDLIEENPDYIYALVASPARGFSDDGLEIQKQWYEIVDNLACVCNAKVLFVNRVGFEDGLGFWGGSCVVDTQGMHIEQLPLFEQEIRTVEVEG